MKECISIKTDYSLLSSLIKIPELISYAKENNFNSLGLIDDNLSSSREFYLECQKNNIKPIIGYHITLNNNDIYLYAKNYAGLKMLFKLSTFILDNELDIISLTKYLNDIIIILPIQSISLYDELSKLTIVYVAYQNDYEKTNALLVTKNIIYFKLVLALKKDDTKYLDYLKMIDNDEYHDINAFQDNYIYDDNLSYFTDLINLNWETESNLIPKFDNSDNYLKTLAIQGLKKRLNGNIPDNYKERLLYELDIIKRMNFVDYFLIVYDYVKYARNNNILVGPGRGSAAGSLVTYSLGITMIDPIKYNLLFERFLNPERITMPDIDIDFDATKRESVIDYVKNKYGNFNVMPIMTYGTFASKQALISVSKILKVDIEYLNKNINSKISLKENLTPKVINILKSNPDLKKVYNIALKLEGLKKHISTHAAGIIICRKPLDEIIPITKSGEAYLTGYTMNYLENLGLLKMDFLAIKDLTTISDVLETIKRPLNINNINLNDLEVLNNFTNANTTGIFQFESEGMKNFLTKLKPTSFNDLIVALALYRPGPMENIPTFIKRKEGKEKTNYLIPELENILKDTYGIIIYQEQIMQIFTTIASYSYAEADLIRRAISKKKENIIIQEQDNFISKAQKNGYDKKISQEIYSYILKFANYGFNKSHSVAYALVGYQMMYLKVKYPLKFYTSLLNSNIGSLTKTKEYLDEVKKLNIKIIKPDINLSQERYYVNNGIVMPITVIKNIGIQATKDISQELSKGEFKDFYDFYARVNNLSVNSKIIETLIYAGALDSFKETRKTLIENIKNAAIYAELIGGLDSSLVSKPNLEKYEEYPLNELMDKELQLYGYYISNHPTSRFNGPKINEIEKYFDQNITSVYMLEKINIIKNKKGDTMAFLKLSDETGTISGVLFPNRINFANHISNGYLLKINSHVEKRLDQYQLIINKIEIIKN